MKRKFLSKDEEERIVVAMGRAEKDNRGEVRVHLENRCLGDPLQRARTLFAQLGMVETAADTGVLLYVAHKSRKVAVFAGAGIHDAVADDAWQKLVDDVASACGQGKEVDGVCAAVDAIGDMLRAHVGGADEHGNELPNQVTTS